ncbi:MAG: aminomethyltransferase family protein [Acidimicrobiaceae bacterium]|nr:aminomethyltransferase family protein [Acidimicrobiaceae bacterium]
MTRPAGALRGTPFNGSTVPRMASTWWFGWGGYVVPDVYTDPVSELRAVRSSVSMNEMSPIPKIEVRGPGAPACVDYLITRDASKMEVGHATYTPWCTHEGKVVADGIVFRFGPDRFVFSGDRCETFLRKQAAGFDVEVADVTDDHGILAVQGPRSRQVLEAVTGESWSDLRFSKFRAAVIDGVRVNVARQGFTGELGYELWVERPDGERVWEAVASAGEPFGIQPAGEYAIDIARVEAGLILISADYTGAGPDAPSADTAPNPDDFVTPYELGLGHCVKLDKAADFVGRDALDAERRCGPGRRMVGLTFDVQGIAKLFLDAGLAPDVSPRVRWDHLALRAGADVVGRASSVTWSPTTSRLIGFGLVPAELAEAGTGLTVEWADFWGRPLGDAAAEVCQYPFIELSRQEG